MGSPVVTWPTCCAVCSEPRRFIQVLSGARQVGKTTVARQVAERSGLPVRYASADEPTLRDAAWITAQWEAARLLVGEAGADGALLILDEVQKVTGWSDVVKGHWDADSYAGRPLKVVLLGSAPLLGADPLLSARGRRG